MINIFCDECNQEMLYGYVIHDGIEHYCSDECLHKNINEEGYKYLNQDGYAFWTTFED